MSRNDRTDAGDAVELARECFNRIVSVLDETIDKAEQLGARDMLERLTAAKAAADRGSELIGNLALMLQAERPIPNADASTLAGRG